ncbi:hypothetical protein OROGR_012075 [Orobanche gracilis]
MSDSVEMPDSGEMPDATTMYIGFKQTLQKSDVHHFLSESRNVVDGVMTDLDKYIAEPLEVKLDKKFDILSWWKDHKGAYPILSQVARDVLAIQVSTVAPESAFSAGGRVIDAFRSRLDPDIVEALICTKDWVAASRKGSQKNVASILGDLEVYDTLLANMDEDEEEMTSDED